MASDRVPRRRHGENIDMEKTISLAAELRSAWAVHAQRSPYISYGLAGAVLIIVALIIVSIISAVSGGNALNLRHALLGGSAGFAATTLGAFLALTMKAISTRRQDSMLGF